MSADGLPDVQVNALAAAAGQNGRSPSAGLRGSREGPSEALIRNRAIIARVTLDEKERVHEDARQAGKETVSEYIREKLGLERHSGAAKRPAVSEHHGDDAADDLDRFAGFVDGDCFPDAEGDA